MDEIDLFYHLQVDHSLATKQLKGRKKDKERLLLLFDARMTSRNVLLIVDNCPAHPKRRFYSSILEGYKKGEKNYEKINVLDTIHFINDAWNIDVKPTTIANYFRHCKIQSEEDMPFEQEIGDVEGIHKLKESLTDEEIIQGVMDVPANDEQDLNDSNVLPHVSPKEAFLVVDTLKNYLIQYEKNIPDLVYAPSKS
ncbi:hypothetical protein Goshw_007216 [Gossypium schwendimanii]|uniref:DDE-1 domain-containing protein n=1 Tax=Gossypium schwendimanii TaxID=34291 RepID=A0A7J9N1H9_GOSSC|nr:hypothetical protein [Gossypium schwendimanii]